MMTDHYCAAEKRCRDAQTINGQRISAIIAEQRGLCRRCYAAVQRSVMALQADSEALNAAIGDKTQSANLHVSGTPEPPMPLNGTVLALHSSLGEWCEAALWMVAETLGIDPKIRHKAKGWPVRDKPVIAQAARVLPDNLRALLTAPQQSVSVWFKTGGWEAVELDGVDVALKLSDLHHDVETLLGQTHQRRRLSMPCPILDCGAPTLGINNGSTDIDCMTCGGRWTEREYNWLAHMIMAEHEHEETEMLKWLLAEAQYRLIESDSKLYEVRRLLTMTEDDLAGIDGYAVVELLRGMLSDSDASVSGC
jgi:hypothetical protein